MESEHIEVFEFRKKDSGIFIGTQRHATLAHAAKENYFEIRNKKTDINPKKVSNTAHTVNTHEP